MLLCNGWVTPTFKSVPAPSNKTNGCYITAYR